MNDAAPEFYRGWADIAAPLEVSPDTAERYAARSFDPLPVYYDHAERPCCRGDAMQAWVSRQSFYYASYHALRQSRNLPSQRSERGAPLKRRRTKVARQSDA
jgi:hypothetical protein